MDRVQWEQETYTQREIGTAKREGSKKGRKQEERTIEWNNKIYQNI
jgi:hypothetical protein